MKRYVYSEEGNKLLRIEEATPICGDYCDTCGDCLHCYGGEPCYESQGGEHFWVTYEQAAPTPARSPDSDVDGSEGE